MIFHERTMFRASFRCDSNLSTVTALEYLWTRIVNSRGRCPRPHCMAVCLPLFRSSGKIPQFSLPRSFPNNFAQMEPVLGLSIAILPCHPSTPMILSSTRRRLFSMLALVQCCGMWLILRRSIVVSYRDVQLSSLGHQNELREDTGWICEYVSQWYCCLSQAIAITDSSLFLPSYSVPFSETDMSYLFTPREVLRPLFSSLGKDFPQSLEQPYNFSTLVDPLDSLPEALNMSGIALGGESVCDSEV